MRVLLTGLMLTVLLISQCSSSGDVDDFDWSHSDPDVFNGLSYAELMDIPFRGMPYSLMDLSRYSVFFDYPDSRLSRVKITYNYSYSKISRPVRTGSSISLAGMLDDPSGVSVSQIGSTGFNNIRKAGFESVRIPIRPSVYPLSGDPSVPDAEFLHVLDGLINGALAAGLKVVLCLNEEYKNGAFQLDYESSRDRLEYEKSLVSYWVLLAERYKNYPDTLSFELLMIPRYPVTINDWNRLVGILINVIRTSGGNNSRRTLIISPARWGHVSALPFLELPDYTKDPHIKVKIFYIDPIAFTLQDGTWLPIFLLPRSWKGNTWNNTERQVRIIQRDFDLINDWAVKQHRTIIVGDFFVDSSADRDSVVNYTSLLRREAEERNFQWVYNTYQLPFSGLYSISKSGWKKEIIDVLIPPE
jgi:endoglucanase